MCNYKKIIDVTSTGMVIAKIVGPDNSNHGLAFFSAIINTNKGVERQCKRAHKWCDDRINICKKYITN